MPQANSSHFCYSVLQLNVQWLRVSLNFLECVHSNYAVVRQKECRCHGCGAGRWKGRVQIPK